MRTREVLARFELVHRAAVRALGMTRLAHIKVDLGVAAPNFHVRLGAWAIHPTLVVQVFGQ